MFWKNNNHKDKRPGVSFELTGEHRLPGRDLLEENSWDYPFHKADKSCWIACCVILCFLLFSKTWENQCSARTRHTGTNVLSHVLTPRGRSAPLMCRKNHRGFQIFPHILISEIHPADEYFRVRIVPRWCPGTDLQLIISGQSKSTEWQASSS